MQFGAGGGQVLLAEKVEQKHVALLGEIVTTLVGAIDEALDAGQILIGRLWNAGHILGMPQFEIGQVLFRHGAVETRQREGHNGDFVMPGSRATVLQGSDLQRAERRCG